LVQEAGSTQAQSFGPDELEKKVKKVKKEAKQEITDVDPQVQRVVQGARRITAQEYLERFPQPRDISAEYVVGGNDVLNIKVYNEPDLTQQGLRVSSDGMITFPFIGTVQASGRTSAEIEEEITTRLVEGGFFIDPHISVSVSEYRSKKVLALGAVQDPGTYPLRQSVRVLDVLSQAGGIDFERGGNVVTLIREQELEGRNRKLAIQIDLRDLLSGEQQATNLYLRDNDVIFVPKAAKIYVVGQVNSPGEYTLGQARLSLVEAIGQAGGFTRLAARNKVRVVRQTGSGEKTMVVNVDKIMEGERTGEDVVLQSGDVVVVPESFF
jgi:polysaccharide export outer membrane protein